MWGRSPTLLHDGLQSHVREMRSSAMSIILSLTWGFFRGATLTDPDLLLQGTGRFMRHEELRPETPANASAPKQTHRDLVLGYKGRRRKRLAQRNALGPSV